MSAFQALVWLPAAVCGDVASATDDVLSRWAETWGLPPPRPGHCEALEAGAEALQGLIDLRCAATPELKKALALALFKFDVTGSAVGDAVTEKVAEALANQLVEMFAAAPGGDEEQSPLGHQGVRVVVELLGLRCGFALTLAQLRACARLVAPPPPGIAGVNLEVALAEIAVPLVAELGRAEIDLNELMQLAPGDVLLLKEKLDMPLRVVAPGSALELAAELGAASSTCRRAVRWLAS